MSWMLNWYRAGGNTSPLQDIIYVVQSIFYGEVQKIKTLKGELQKIEPIEGVVRKQKTLIGNIQKITALEGIIKSKINLTGDVKK